MAEASDNRIPRVSSAMTRPRTAIQHRAPLNNENPDYASRAALNHSKLEKHGARRRFPGQFGMLTKLPSMMMNLKGANGAIAVRKRSKSRPKTALTRMDNNSPEMSVLKPRN